MSGLQIERLAEAADAPFPPTSHALYRPNGLLAWGGGLEPTRLLNAYRQGIFPWYSEDEPILWWSPAPRCVIYPAEIHLSRRTRRRYNTGNYQITADTAFRDVIKACSQPRKGQPGTWITYALQTAFEQLHRSGHAHSVELWQDHRLIGGVYGLAIGKVFFGESMFSRETDASKIALVALCRQLSEWNYGLLDCQVTNPHLTSLGAVEIPRHEFESCIADLVARLQSSGSWTKDFKTDVRW